MVMMFEIDDEKIDNVDDDDDDDDDGNFKKNLKLILLEKY